MSTYFNFHEALNICISDWFKVRHSCINSLMKSKYCEMSVFNFSVFWNLTLIFCRHQISLLSYVSVVFQHCDLLGDELLECLSWRRGALLYMYCHSLTKRREWLTRKSGLLKEVKRHSSFLIVDIYSFLKAIFDVV